MLKNLCEQFLGLIRVTGLHVQTPLGISRFVTVVGFLLTDTLVTRSRFFHQRLSVFGVKALEHDRYGIAYANLHYLTPQVKSIALAPTDDAPYYEATKLNLIQRKYPLTRAASIYINREPGKPIDPKVKEFLRYVLSQEGQQSVVQEGEFLPLSEEGVHNQMRKLEY